MYVLCHGELIDTNYSNFQFDKMKCKLVKYVNENTSYSRLRVMFERDQV